MRFVVLRHSGWGLTHYDILLEPQEAAPSLISFHAGAWPIRTCQPLQRVQDHRREYLTLEGPISGGRGQVRRVAAGECLAHPGPQGEPEAFTLKDSAGAHAVRIERTSDGWMAIPISEV
ncbi:MAG: hypothetical protein NZ561_00235 [Phycisphaerae bacterium]|nr:hypothetical protein [Phycisphaerae bacterium]MDW8261567.1 hypothetical protein [Phycisphaerales bacterium]